MVATKNQGNLLETVEESQNAISNVKELWLTRMESTRDGKLPKRHMAFGTNAKQCINQRNISQSWIHFYDLLLYENS